MTTKAQIPNKQPKRTPPKKQPKPVKRTGPFRGPEKKGGPDPFADDDGMLDRLSPVEIAVAAAAEREPNGVADDKMKPTDIQALQGPLAAKIKTELSERFPEADLAGLATQLSHSIAGCPATVYEYNQPVGVHAGEVTPQTIGALCLVIEAVLAN